MTSLGRKKTESKCLANFLRTISQTRSLFPQSQHKRKGIVDKCSYVTCTKKDTLTEGQERGGGGVNVGHSLSPPSHFMLATGLFWPVVMSLKTQFLRSIAFVKFPCVDCKKSVRTVTKTSKSVIDVTLVNRPEHWATSGSLQLGMSDHTFSILLRNVFNYKGIQELCYFVIWQI